MSGAGYTGPQLYDYAFNNIEPLLEGISGVASAAPDGGRMRQINVVVDPVKAQARGVTAPTTSRPRWPSRTRSCRRASSSRRSFDANVYTNAIPQRVETIGDAPVKVVGGKPVLIRDVARVEDGGTPADAVRRRSTARTPCYLNVLRIPGGNTIEIVDAVKKVVDGPERPAAGHAGRRRSSISRPSCARPTTGSRRRSSRRSSSSRSSSCSSCRACAAR